ncbi:SCO5717 family growth-regulating ATPase [Streptomyces dangxiongensis]|uniref:SCO5717 family growth-regulating ATPase n=1 Tax=Streptomyces dangxiongensis TaxID=1442032 RepID=UPI0023E3F7CD|nr:SCO5717 family growth-regulating ATPase [Streptomyces dangxiongensis]
MSSDRDGTRGGWDTPGDDQPDAEAVETTGEFTIDYAPPAWYTQNASGTGGGLGRRERLRPVRGPPGRGRPGLLGGPRTAVPHGYAGHRPDTASPAHPADGHPAPERAVRAAAGGSLHAAAGDSVRAAAGHPVAGGAVRPTTGGSLHAAAGRSGTGHTGAGDPGARDPGARDSVRPAGSARAGGRSAVRVALAAHAAARAAGRQPPPHAAAARGLRAAGSRAAAAGRPAGITGGLPRGRAGDGQR